MLSLSTFLKAIPAILLLFMPLFAENPSGLAGTVIYKVDHAPIRNVYVLVHRDGGVDAHASTDERGKYSIPLSPGVYDVFLSAGGFAPTCQKIEVQPGRMTVFNAVLRASDVGMQQ